jgi:hypothetical protein
MKNKNIKIILMFSLLLILSSFYFKKNILAKEMPGNLIITEVMYNPEGSNSEHAKWIEVFNTTSETIFLNTVGNETSSGWKVENLKLVDSSNHYIYAREDFPIEIRPAEFFIITNNVDNFIDDYPNLNNVVILKSAITLTNSSVRFYDGDNLLDNLEYRVDWGGNDNGNTLEKINFSLDNLEENWQESYQKYGTPMKESSSAENKDENTDIIEDYSGQIIINEIFPYAETDDNEFVELKNIGEIDIDLSGWKIVDGAGHSYIFPEGVFILVGEILYIKQKLYLNNDEDTVFLFDKLTNISQIEEALDRVRYQNAKKNYSYSFDDALWQWTSLPTIGRDNEFDEIIDEKEFESGIYHIGLNEILPNPKGDERKGEYIEIYNGENFLINLKDWTVTDSKQKFIFSKDYFVEAGGYLVIYRDIFKFSLNNSSEETVNLIDPDGNVISSVHYENAKEDIGYSFNGKIWRWSKYLTPNKENKFNIAPEIKIKKIKSGFVGIPLRFEADVKYKNKEDLAYLWDFDDGGKSYLQNVNHIFKNKGNYNIKLIVDNGGEVIEKSFNLKIKKYPSLPIIISRLLPNPLGVDTGIEWIEIKNNSSKEVSLKGWKIATGQKNLINHSVLSEAVIPPGDIMMLTREDALFSLNNKQTIVELRYPNGKVASRVTYKKNKIEENEICQNTGGVCTWSLLENELEDEVENSSIEVGEDEILDVVLMKKDDVAILSEKNNQEELMQNLAQCSQEENFLNEKIYKVNLLECYDEKYLVFDLSLDKDVVYFLEDGYHFTYSAEQKHWAAKFLEDIKNKINLSR